MSMKRLAAESIWVGFGQIVAAAGSVVGVKLLTEVMDPATYGILSLAVISSTLFHSAFWGSLGAAGQRYFSAYQENDRLALFLEILKRLANRSSCIFLAGMFLVLAVFLMLGRYDFFCLIVFSSLFTLLYGYSYIIDGLQNAARNRILVSLHSGALSWFRFLLAFALVSLFGDSSWLAMSGFAFAALLILISEYCFYRHRIVSIATLHEVTYSEEQDIQQKIVGYAWPIAAVGGLIWVQQSADRWALQTFCSSTDVGLYSSLFQIGYAPVVMVFIFLFQTLSPLVFSRAGSGIDPHRLRQADRMNYQMAAVFSLLVFFVFVGVLAFGGKLSYLVGERYRIVFGFLPWMVLSGGIFSVAQTLYGYFMIRGDTRQLWFPTLIYSFIGTILVFLAARFYGVSGVVLARVITSLLYLIFVLFLIVRYGKKKIIETSTFP